MERQVVEKSMSVFSNRMLEILPAFRKTKLDRISDVARLPKNKRDELFYMTYRLASEDPRLRSQLEENWLPELGCLLVSMPLDWGRGGLTFVNTGKCTLVGFFRSGEPRSKFGFVFFDSVNDSQIEEMAKIARVERGIVRWSDNKNMEIWDQVPSVEDAKMRRLYTDVGGGLWLRYSF